jgi:hypothetical protein
LAKGFNTGAEGKPGDPSASTAYNIGLTAGKGLYGAGTIMNHPAVDAIPLVGAFKTATQVEVVTKKRRNA